MSAGWCNGNNIASHAADRGSIPGCGRSASHQTVSGRALAEDAHSLARKIINPLQLVQYFDTEYLMITEKEISTSGNHRKMGVTWPCILLYCCCICSQLKILSASSWTNSVMMSLPSELL